MKTGWLPLLWIGLFAGCGKDAAGIGPDAPSGADAPTGHGISGMITSDQTWSGDVAIVGDTTIVAGVKVTIAEGAHVTAVPAGSIAVAGELDIAGTSAAHVTLVPTSVTWGGFDVSGTLVAHYLDQIGGGIILDGGSVTAMDTTFSHDRDGRDFLIVHSGMVDIEYSAFQPAPGTHDLIHCDMHANQGGTTHIKVVHTNLSDATYGFDFFGGTADLTYNNWFSNQTDLYTEAGSPVTADVSFGWFPSGPPVAAPGSSITTTSLAGARLTDAGPR